MIRWKIFATKHVVLLCEPLNQSKNSKNRHSLLFSICTQHNHVVLRDTPIHTYTLAHNHGTVEGSHTVI